MPTLFEILNRFSKPPVDLWSFYVFLKEQYGGVEYLEFWIDCAAYSSLYQDIEESVKYARFNDFFESPSPEDTGIASRDSSILMEVLGGDGSNGTEDITPQKHENNGQNGNTTLNSAFNENAYNEIGHARADSDPFTPAGSPNASPSRTRRDLGPLQELSLKDPEEDEKDRKKQRMKKENVFWLSSMLRGFKSERNGEYNNLKSTTSSDSEDGNSSSIFEPNSPHKPGQISQIRHTMHESVKRIVSLYLLPGAPKQIELPSTSGGWSLAEEIRELIACPGGLDAPDIFEKATNYVFEVLEREALPAFLVSRALSNIQPVSGTMRLLGGLVALFAAFWLSFVFILLDWTPKSTRCWVILPFSLGWYFAASSVYRIDPLLSFLGYTERDGGGLTEIEEPFVYNLLYRRGLFVMSAVVILTACFSVLFIFVPGYRL